jgi:hypothetical protein
LYHLATGVRSQTLRDWQAKVNEEMKKLSVQISPDKWYVCMPQLVSRVGHRNPDTVNIITSILLKVLTSFPRQVIINGLLPL